MKNLFIPLSVMLILFTVATSCKKVVTALFPGIDARVPDIVITVPPTIIAPPGEISLGTYSAQFNLDSTIRANTAGLFNADDVSGIKVKSITVSALNADNLNNLSNFEYARLSIASNTNVNEVAVATINFPDSETSTITVTPDNSPDLRNYLAGNQLHYNVYGKIRRATTKSLNLLVAVTLRVE